MRASCVHTAVIRRNEMQHDNRSMNGTRLIAASSGFLPPFPVGVGAAPPIVSLQKVESLEFRVESLGEVPVWNSRLSTHNSQLTRLLANPSSRCGDPRRG